MRTKFSYIRRFALALISSAAALPSAQALTLCVNDVATLKAALDFGQFATGAPLSIKIVQGTYLMDTDLSYAFAAPATIEGGYTAGCSSRVVNPANTTINIGLEHNLHWDQTKASPEARLTVDGITFSNASTTVSFAAGDYHNIGSNDEGSVHLKNLRFTLMTKVAAYAFDNALTLENVLIDHLTGVDDAVYLHSNGGAAIALNHVTVDLKSGQNLEFASGVGTGDTDPFEARVSNSILWSSDGGTGTFIGALPGSVALFSNVLSKPPLLTGTNVQIDNPINAAPGWINPATGNYHLQTAPPSVAINSGTAIVPGGEPALDIEGNPRIVGSKPDRGAFESGFIDFNVLTVSNRLDSGAGSLRQAILDANSSPSIAKSIKFDIRTAANVPICPAVIPLNTVLPAIASTVLIDGYTQPGATPNTSAAGFNANICVLLTSGVGSLASGFRVPSTADGSTSLTLRGLGIGGFAQPIQILGGLGHVIAGNQFGGNVGAVNLPGAAFNAISIGVNAGGSLIVGGINLSDRNVIGGASFSGVDIQSAVQSSTDKCQIVNNLIGLAPNGSTPLANNIGINNGGSGCALVLNRVAGNTSINISISGDANVVQKNFIGVTAQDLGVSGNAAVGLQVQGSDNIIGASGAGGSISSNTVRFNNAGGIIIKGNAATGNSLNANLSYDNGASFNAMDIDLSPTGAASVGVGIAALTPNDPGDNDTGPNQLQNFPTGTSLVNTDNGTGPNMINRAATVTGSLDSMPGAYRIDAYYSTAANPLGLQGRGHAEVYLGHRTVLALGGGVISFTMPVVIPTQIASGVVSFTATDSFGNTSEIGTGLSIVAAPVVVVDAMFKNGFE